MKKGNVINGYVILQDFTTAGGGMCKWTFAEKGGSEYFIKEFLFPTYPVEGAPGSPKTKDEKRKQCEAFEAHHMRLMTALAGKCAAGGNLVVTKDFFRCGAKYYKVTDKVDVASLQVGDVATLPLEKRILVLKTVAHSLRILHQAGIVHGDLKPDNILIKVTATGDYTTKLIDFDNSYFSGKPPIITDEVVGSMEYYSPELGLYIQRDRSATPQGLQLKSDIFALGLIYCQYLTGELPFFDLKKYKYPYVAVVDGGKLTVDRHQPPILISLINSMLARNPHERPDIDTVFTQLKHKDLRAPKVSELDGPMRKAPESAARLRGALVRREARGGRESETPSLKTPSSKLRGTLVEKKPKTRE